MSKLFPSPPSQLRFTQIEKDFRAPPAKVVSPSLPPLPAPAAIHISQSQTITQVAGAKSTYPSNSHSVPSYLNHPPALPGSAPKKKSFRPPLRRSLGLGGGDGGGRSPHLTKPFTMTSFDLLWNDYDAGRFVQASDLVQATAVVYQEVNGDRGCLPDESPPLGEHGDELSLEKELPGEENEALIQVELAANKDSLSESQKSVLEKHPFSTIKASKPPPAAEVSGNSSPMSDFDDEIYLDIDLRQSDKERFREAVALPIDTDAESLRPKADLDMGVEGFDQWWSGLDEMGREPEADAALLDDHPPHPKSVKEGSIQHEVGDDRFPRGESWARPRAEKPNHFDFTHSKDNQPPATEPWPTNKLLNFSQPSRSNESYATQPQRSDHSRSFDESPPVEETLCSVGSRRVSKFSFRKLPRHGSWDESEASDEERGDRTLSHECRDPGETDQHRRPPPGESDQHRRPPPRETDQHRRPPLGETDQHRRMPSGETDQHCRPPPGETDQHQRPPLGKTDQHRRPPLGETDQHRRAPPGETDQHRRPPPGETDQHLRPPPGETDQYQRPPPSSCPDRPGQSVDFHPLPHQQRETSSNPQRGNLTLPNHDHRIPESQWRRENGQQRHHGWVSDHQQHQRFSADHATRRSEMGGGDPILVSIGDIPVEYRPFFGFTQFNRVQSALFHDAFRSSKSLVVSAPTGSGKTVVFELALLRLLSSRGGGAGSGGGDASGADNARIAVYMAPTKALCNEKYQNWKSRFEALSSHLSVSCHLMTGDSDLDLGSPEFVSCLRAGSVCVIVSTPEKWDMMTRNWRENPTGIQDLHLGWWVVCVCLVHADCSMSKWLFCVKLDELVMR